MYSGYGGYSGSSGYGSTGYGSSYGSSYGNSYGGGYNSSSAYNRYNQPNMPNGNSPIDPNQDPNVPNPNPRKIAMEEYFKMMGGLQSIAQMGFTMVTFANCASHAWQLLKNILTFLLKTSKNIGYKFGSLFSSNSKLSQFCKKIMMSSQKQNSHTLQNKIFLALRVISVIVLLLCTQLHKGIQQDIAESKEQILKQCDQLKLQQQELRQNKQEMVHYKECL